MENEVENEVKNREKEENVTDTISENKIEEKPIVRNEFIETESLKLIMETELEKFDLKNEEIKNYIEVEFENEFEEQEEELENELEEENQIQVFSKFEDLENHIQNIENKNNLDSDKSENQSQS